MPIPNDQLTNTQTGSIENNDPNVPVKKITPPANTGNDIASRLSVIQSNIETSKPYTKTEPVPVKKAAAAIVSEPVKTVPAEKLPQQQEQPESQPTLVDDDYVKKIYDYGVSKNLTSAPYDTFKQKWFSDDQSKQRFYDELSNMSTYEKLPFNVGKTYEEFDSNVKYKGVPKYTDEQKRKLSEGVNDLFGSVNNVITSAVDKISELPTALNDFGQNLNEELKAKYNQTERDPRKNPLSPEFDADRVLADKTDVFNQSKFLTQNEDTDYLKKIGAINQYTEEGTKEELYQLNAEREGLLQSKKQLEELPAFNAQERLTEINSKLDGLDKKIKDKQDILDGVVKQQGVLSNIDKLNQDAFEDISSSWNAPDYDTKRDAYVKKYGEQDVVQAEQELLQRDSDNKLAREIENNPDAILDYKNWNRYKRYIDERFQKRLDKERESFINKNMNELLSQSESEKKALETKAYSDIEDYTNKAALRTQQQVDAIINSNQEFKTLREDYLARMRNAATQEEKNQINQEYKNVINNIPEIKKINDAFKADVEKKSSEIIGQANDKFNKTFNDKITSAIKTHEEKNMVNWLSKAYAPVVNKKEVLQPYVQSVKDEMSKMNLTEGQRKAFLKAEWSRYMRSKIASDPEVSKKVMNTANLKTAEREFYAQFADQLYDSRRQPSAYALKSMIEDKLAEVEDQIKMVKKRVSSTSERGSEEYTIPTGVNFVNANVTAGQLESRARLQNLEETKRRLEQAADHPETDSGYWSDFWRGLSSKEGIEYIPVVGSLYNISHDLTVKDVADKMAEGKPLQWHEKGLLESLAMQKEFTKLRPTSTAYSVGQGIGEMVPIIGEFMLTAGLGTAAKSTTTKILKNQIQKSITKNIESQIAKGIVTKEAGDAMLKEGIKQIGESGTSKYLIKGLSLFIQANAQTAANPQQYIEKTIERMTPQVSMMMTDQGDKLELQIDSRGEDFGEAFLKAYGSTATEFLTEAAGGSMLFKAGGKVSKEVMNPEWFKRTLLGSWMSKRGINSVDNAYKIILKEKLGWNGVLSELGEEIDAHALEGLITGDHSMIMTPDELLNTALTVGVMGAAFKTPSVLRPIGKFIKDKMSNTVVSVEGLKDKDGKNKTITVPTDKWNKFTKLQDRPYASDFEVTRAIEKLGLPEEESAFLKQFHYQSMAKKNESLEKAETLKKPTVPAPEKRENAFGYEDFTENPNYSDANQAKHTPSDIIALNSALESGKKDEKIVNQESLHNAEKWALNTRDLVAKNESLSEEEKKNTLDYLGGIIANIRTEHELQNEKQNDKEDQKGVSGEVGIGQELVETKPIEEGSAKTTEPGGMVQTPQEEVATKQEPVAEAKQPIATAQEKPSSRKENTDRVKKKKQQEVKQETEDLLDAVAVASEPVYETQDKTVSSPSVKREANVVYNELREATEERIKIERKIKSRDSWKGQELRAEKQQLTRRLNKINKRIFELNSEYSDITGKNIGDITEDVYLDIVNTTEQKPTVKEEVKPVKTETKKDIVAERIKALETGENVKSVFEDIGNPIEEEAAVIREKLGISDSKAVTSQQLYDAYSKKKGKKEWDRFYNVLRNEIGQVRYKKRKAEEKAKQEEEKRKKEAQEAQAMKTTKASAEGRVSESEAAHKGSKKKTDPKEEKVDFDYKEIYDFEKDAIEAGIKKNSRFWNNIVRALKIISNPANHKSVTQQPYDSAEDAIKALMKTVKDEVESKLTVATKQTGTAFRRIENKIKELSKQKPEAKTEIKKEVKSEPVVEEYVPITQKDIEIGKFRKDEALDYYTDEKELDSGRMSEYISSMTVDVTNMEGESIGNLVRNTDEDKNNTWEALDSDGNNITIGRGKNSVDEFDTKQEAIDAILNAYNKKKKKEFDAEQKRINKKKEKEAQKEKNKVKEIEEDPALKSVEKSRKEKKSKIIEKAEKELEQQTEEFSAKKLDVESIGAAAKMPAVTLVINKLKDARKNIKNFKNHKELAEYLKVNDELFGSYILRLFDSNIINRDQMNQLNRLYSEIQRDITLLSDKKSSIDELYANPILRSQGGKTNTGVVFMQSKEERLAPEYLEPSAEVKTKKTEQIINQFYNRLVKSFDKLKSKDKRFSYFKKMTIKKALDRVKVTNAVAKKKNAPVGFFDTLFKHIVLVSTGRNDLDTFVHEIGHNVDVELGFLESLENNPAAIEEVKNLSRFSPTKTEDGTTNQLREGLAEFIRAIAIAPNSTAQLYPELTKAYQELVPSEIQGAVSEIGDHYRMVASMDTFDRGTQTMLMAEDIKREKQIKVKELGTVFRYKAPVWIMQKFVDRLYTTNAIIRILRAYDPNKEFKGLSDPELLMRLYAGVGVKAESWLHDGLRDKNFKVKTDEITGEAISLRWVMDLFDKMNSKKQKKDKDFVSLYMTAQRFIELRNRDIEEHKEEVDSYVNSMNEAVAKLDEKIDEKETYILLLQNKLDDIKSSNSKAGKSDLEYKIKKSKEKLNSLKQQKKTAQQNIQEAEASKETYKPSDDYINLSSGVGMDNYQSAVDIINKVELMKDTNPELYKLATETARRYRVYAENLLEYLVETGKLSKSDFKTIKSKNQYYVALNRIETDSEGLVVKPKPTNVNTENLSSQKFQIKKVQGSEKTVVDPFLSLCVNTHKIAAEGDRNEILSNLTNIINHVANNNGSFAEMMGGYLVGKEEIDPKTGLKVQPEIKTDGTTVVYRNGLKEYWKFNEDFDTAIKGILNSSAYIPIISDITKLVKNIYTLTPKFILENFERDTLERFMVSPTGSPLKGFKPGKKFSEERDLFRATGGSQSYLYSMGENTEEFLLDLQKELKRKRNFISKINFRNIKGSIAKLENANRVAEFRHARKVYEQETIKRLRKENEMAVSVGAEPKTDQQIIEEAQANAIVMAAADARGLMDFYVAGEYMRVINQVVPFANASIRGSARYIQSLINFKDPNYFKIFFIRNIIYGSLAELLAKGIEDYLIGDDEDKTEEVLERRKYEKDMFYQIPTPLGNISIAKPHSASLFANYAGEIYDYYVRGDKYAFSGSTEKLIRFTGFFDNVENSNTITAIGRWLGMVDTDSWGGYVIDPDESYVPVSLRFPHKRQALSGAIEDTFGIDARNVDSFISGFGWWGKIFNQGINFFAGEKDSFDMTSTGLFRKQKPGGTESSIRLKDERYKFGLKGRSEDSKRDDDYVLPALGRLKREVYSDERTDEEKADLAKTLRTVNRKIRMELDRRAEEYGGDEYMNTSILFEKGKKKEAKESIDNMKKIVDYINKKID